MDANPIDFPTIRDLGRMLRDGSVSSRLLAERSIERLETVGRRFNAVVVIDAETALRDAQRADDELAAGIDRGPLHGIPYGAKDLLATVNMPTAWGCAPYRDRVLTPDATVITRLRQAGAVLVAKLAMAELAGGMGYNQPNATFTGPAINPWNVDAWAGGSSSGSATAVAAGCVPFALGSETVGSIISPAGFCGVTGLCPSYGRVSRSGAMALSWTLDKVGPITRSADDSGLVFAAIAGPDQRDPSTLETSYAFQSENERRSGFRIGVLHDGVEHSQPEIRANFDATLDALEAFAHLEPVELPDYPYYAIAQLINRSEGSAALGELFESGKIHELTAPEDRVGGYSSFSIPAVDYLRAMRVRAKLIRDLDDLLGRYDAIVHPSFNMVASPLDVPFDVYRGPVRWSQVSAAGNLAGLPMVTIPNGLGERDLPTGVQFISQAGREATVLSIASELQSRTSWHERHPAV